MSDRKYGVFKGIKTVIHYGAFTFIKFCVLFRISLYIFPKKSYNVGVMNSKKYFGVTSFIFLIISALHLYRVIDGWEAVIGGYSVPMWISWTAVLVAGLLAFHGYKLSKHN